MSVQVPLLATLFSDICDSVQLYESVGDAEAHRLADECVRSMGETVRRNGGSVVKTFGDGMMSTFVEADAAFRAAIEMQHERSTGPLKIRIGASCGPVIQTGEDVFGDAVNLAARVSALARPGEILLTEELIEQLSPPHREATRLLDTTNVKGRTKPVNVYAVTDHGDFQATTMIDESALIAAAGLPGILVLAFRDKEVRVTGFSAPVALGRDERCDLVVPSGYASRRHATIAPKRDHYLLTDQSTNGTFLVNQEGELAFVKRETVQLVGSGSISLGAKPTSEPDFVVKFYCRSPA
ncbi:MAG TPA: adenylate/guanylate cyclase domain-containing protein [Alphaproteobacteria bacterium]|nr:adenylate/guanylate cyclase domain-containing protein [Alphaproteobacteria bacterium]